MTIRSFKIYFTTINVSPSKTKGEWLSDIQSREYIYTVYVRTAILNNFILSLQALSAMLTMVVLVEGSNFSAYHSIQYGSNTMSVQIVILRQPP